MRWNNRNTKLNNPFFYEALQTSRLIKKFAKSRKSESNLFELSRCSVESNRDKAQFVVVSIYTFYPSDSPGNSEKSFEFLGPMAAISDIGPLITNLVRMVGCTMARYDSVCAHYRS